MSDHLPVPSWATAPAEILADIRKEQEVPPIEVNKDIIVQGLMIESKDRRSKNQSARISALITVAKLKGYLNPNVEDIDAISEEELNRPLTKEEVELVKARFENDC